MPGCGISGFVGDVKHVNSERHPRTVQGWHQTLFDLEQYEIYQRKGLVVGWRCDFSSNILDEWIYRATQIDTRRPPELERLSHRSQSVNIRYRKEVLSSLRKGVRNARGIREWLDQLPHIDFQHLQLQLTLVVQPSLIKSKSIPIGRVRSDGRNPYWEAVSTSSQLLGTCARAEANLTQNTCSSLALSSLKCPKLIQSTWLLLFTRIYEDQRIITNTQVQWQDQSRETVHKFGQSGPAKAKYG